MVGSFRLDLQTPSRAGGDLTFEDRSLDFDVIPVPVRGDSAKRTPGMGRAGRDRNRGCRGDGHPRRGGRVRPRVPSSGDGHSVRRLGRIRGWEASSVGWGGHDETPGSSCAGSIVAWDGAWGDSPREAYGGFKTLTAMGVLEFGQEENSPKERGELDEENGEIQDLKFEI